MIFKTKSYAIAAILLGASFGHCAEIVETQHFKAIFLSAGETRYQFEINDDGTKTTYPIVGEEDWTDKQKATIQRSFENIERSFDFSSSDKKMEIAFALSKLDGAIASSDPSLIMSNGVQASAGELLLRDNAAISEKEGNDVDNSITFNSRYSDFLSFEQGLPGHMKLDYEMLLTHELLHGIGVTSGHDENGSFSNGITAYASLLQDKDGNVPINSDELSILIKGELGTVYWTGEYANATYGGQLPVQTFPDIFIPGSSIAHPGVFGDLMYWEATTGTVSREINKLQLDMFRDMGWSINEAYYNSFGPTFYRTDATIVNNDDFTTSHGYTYGMHVNGNRNIIKQHAELITTQGQSKALSVHGNNNRLELTSAGSLEAQGDYSYGLYWLVDESAPNEAEIAIDSGASIKVTGLDSIAVVTIGSGNTIIHSGDIEASGKATTAMWVDRPYTDSPSLSPYLTTLHVQDGSTIIGDIINVHTEKKGLVTFGREYGGDGKYQLDHNFTFSYNDSISGLWDYEIAAGTVTFGSEANLELDGQMEVLTAGSFVMNGKMDILSRGNFVNNGVLLGTGMVVGDITSGGTIAPGNSIGNLSVIGDVTLTEKSNLQIEFGGEGNDKLIVGGTSHLNGTLSLIPTGGYLAPGNYQFIEGSTDGEFDVIENFSSSILQTSADATSGNFSLTRNSYLSVAEADQVSMASVFDSLRPTASGEMADVLDTIDVMEVADFRNALADYSPAFYGSVTIATLENIQSRSSFLQNKLLARTEAKGSPLWFSAFGGDVEYDQLGSSDAFKAKHKGVMFGGEKRYETGFTFGGAAGFSDLNLDDVHSSSNATSTVYDASLFGSWFPFGGDGFYLQSVLNIGMGDMKVDREVTFLDTATSSKHDFSYHSGFLSAGYSIKMGDWSIRPGIGIEYIQLDEDGFSESGEDAVALTVAQKDSEALLSSLGFDLSRQFSYDNGVLIPRFHAKWLHNFSVDGEDLETSLESGDVFSFAGRDGSEDALEFGVDLSVFMNDRVSADVGYQYTVANHRSGAHLMNFRLNYSF